MEHAIVCSLIACGFALLFDYSMWQGNILEWYFDLVKGRPIEKVVGLCLPCTYFWWSWIYVICDLNFKNYLVFLFFGELILVFYTLIKLIASKN